MDISLSTCAFTPAAMGNRASVTCLYVSSLVPPSAIICAVRYARPGLSAGSAADPVVNTIRKVTSGDFPGSATVRICAEAQGTRSKRQTIDVGRVDNLRGG